jgi:DNA segregation ATPase FtsK/SpoIIIE-like protein
MTAQDFFAFKNYFSLEYFRRQALFKKHKVKDYKEYLSLMKQNPDNPEIEKLNYIYILIDEFQSLRKRVSSLINEVIFDNKMKELLDTVRST